MADHLSRHANQLLLECRALLTTRSAVSSSPVTPENLTHVGRLITRVQELLCNIADYMSSSISCMPLVSAAIATQGPPAPALLDLQLVARQVFGMQLQIIDFEANLFSRCFTVWATASNTSAGTICNCTTLLQAARAVDESHCASSRSNLQMTTPSVPL